MPLDLSIHPKAKSEGLFEVANRSFHPCHSCGKERFPYEGILIHLYFGFSSFSRQSTHLGLLRSSALINKIWNFLDTSKTLGLAEEVINAHSKNVGGIKKSRNS